MTATAAPPGFADGVLTTVLGGNYTPAFCGLLRPGCLHSAGAEPDFT